MTPAPPDAPRIGLWGLVDLPDLELAVARSVLESELRRRLPAAELRWGAPVGRDRPLALDGGVGAEPLGGVRAPRPEDLADRLDAVIVCGPGALAPAGWVEKRYGGGPVGRAAAATSDLLIAGLGPELEARCPIVWAGVTVPVDLDPPAADLVRTAGARRPYIAVIDDGVSRQRLAAAGVASTVETVPPHGVLLPGLLGNRFLDRRREVLRLLDWLPRDRPTIVVQGDARCLADAKPITEALQHPGEHAVVLLDSHDGGDAAFADRVEERLGTGCHRLPAILGPEDAAAVISGAAAVLASSTVAVSLAVGAGVPVGLLRPTPATMQLLRESRAAAPAGEPPGETVERLLSAEIPPPTPEALLHRLDRHLDRLARFGTDAAARRGRGAQAGERPADLIDRLAVLEMAHEVRGDRLLHDHIAYQAELARHLTALEEERRATARARQELAAVGAELDRVRASRTWRYSRRLRTVCERFRRFRPPQ